MTRLGQRKTLLLAFAAILAALVGCQVVAGIQSRSLDPLNPVCQLPSGSGPTVRFADLLPTSDLVDLCIRPTGSSDWGLPLLAGGGTACSSSTELNAAGFAYTQVSVTFNAPAATVDVKAIPGGSPCTVAALSEGDGLALATNATTTLASIGGNNVANQIVAWPEADAAETSGQRFRFVHAAPGTGPVDLGLTKDAHLPTTEVSDLFSQAVPFGGPVPSGTTSGFAGATLEDNGYLQLLTGKFQVGANLDGDTSAKALFEYTFPAGTNTYSTYLIGIAGNTQYPLRALTCSEDTNLAPPTPLTIGCVPSTLSSISVDVWNPALYGPNSPYFADRRNVVPAALAAPSPAADVVCLVEVDEDVDKNAILAAATNTTGGSGPYGYVYLPTTDLSTQPTNPKAQNGQVPPPPTTTPCNGVDPSVVSAAIQCGEQNCSTSTGDPSGQLQGSTDCLVSECASDFLNVQGAGATGTTEGLSCYNCLIVYIASDTSWQVAQNNCTTDTRAPLGFSGAENSMILSKYPLNNTDIYVLPSTLYRRSVLYASVQLEDQSVDFYCGFLSTTLNASALPYNGNYGNGATDSQTAWQNEQTYQGQQLISFVQGKSGSNPAIIVGDWRSSIGVSADAGVSPPPNTFLPNDLNPATMTQFQQTSGWVFAGSAVDPSPSPWATQCNFCPEQENPYNLTDSYFVSQPMLANWPSTGPGTITSEQLVFTQGAVSEDGGTDNDPLSPYYGVNISVVRPH